MSIGSVARLPRRPGIRVRKLAFRFRQSVEHGFGAPDNHDDSPAPFDLDQGAGLELADIHFDGSPEGLGARAWLERGDKRYRRGDNARATGNDGRGHQEMAPAEIRLVGHWRGIGGRRVRSPGLLESHLKRRDYTQGFAGLTTEPRAETRRRRRTRTRKEDWINE